MVTQIPEGTVLFKVDPATSSPYNRTRNHPDDQLGRQGQGGGVKGADMLWRWEAGWRDAQVRPTTETNL
jgi:hypothetical protein